MSITGSAKRSLSGVYSRIRPPKPRFLPPELWSAVFELGDLGASDMSNVRLTCTSFATLGRSQAYSTFDFTPFILSGGTGEYRHGFKLEIRNRRLQRLKFWSSDAIAPMVRRCIVHPILLSDDVKHMIIQYGHPPTLISEFFSVLPNFINIHRLDCQHMPFSNHALSQLSRLENLTTLEITSCNITASDIPPSPIRVANVSFCSIWSDYGFGDVTGTLGWLDFLRPESFRRLEIVLEEPELRHLRGIVTFRSTVPNISEMDNVHLHIISILSRSSSLEELCIAPYKTGQSEVEPPPEFEIGSLSLPSLRSYDGPHHLLSWFTLGLELHTLRLTGSEHKPYTSPDNLLKSFHQLDSLGKGKFEVNELEICTTTGFPDQLLSSIGPRFPHLKKLRMRARKVDEVQVCLTALCFASIFIYTGLPKFMKSLPFCLLPRGIESLTVDIRDFDPSFTRVGWVRQASSLRPNLFKQYPTLRYAGCTYYDYMWICDWNRNTEHRRSKVGRAMRRVAFVVAVLGMEDIE